MAENLRTTRYADGTGISLVTSTASTGASSTSPYRYYPNNTSNNVSTYGYLYNWSAVMGNSSSSTSNPSGVQGVCPTGWHVPSYAEWNQLTNYVGSKGVYVCSNGSGNEAKALASKTGWSPSTESCAVGNVASNNNATCFGALPGGTYMQNINSGVGSFGSFGIYAQYWSSTEYNSAYSYSFALSYSSSTSTIYSNSSRIYGLSVRCLRNETSPTSQTQPNVTTGGVMDLNQTSVTIKGTMINPENVSITAQGFEWKTANGTYTQVSATGTSMSYDLTGLSANTSYTYRAFVTTEVGTRYGEEKTFTTLAENFVCGASTVKDIDNNTYHTLQLGNQCWMAENLRARRYADGTYISMGSSNSGDSDASYNYPNNNSNIASTYGYLYSWPAVIHNSSSSSSNPSGVQGVCPTGWHVPSNAEWNQLISYVSGRSEYRCGGTSGNVAKALASKTGWSSTLTTCAVGEASAENDATGFGAMPAGYSWKGTCGSYGTYSLFWTSSEGSTSNNAYSYALSYSNSVVEVYNYSSKVNSYSVRCVRNETDNTSQTQPNVVTGSVTDLDQTSVTLKGSMINPENVSVTAQGFEWKPASGGTYTQVSATGTSMSYDLTGLTASTSYTYRAFVTTAVGTKYGEEKTFTTLSEGFVCGSSTVKDVDNNTYHTLQLGSQCWMAENLRARRYADGTYISMGSSNSGDSDASYNYPNNNSNIASTYGYLYSWPAVIHNSSSSSSNPSGVQGVCPTGWHVPSNAEWNQLISYVSGRSEYRCGGTSGNVAKALASKTGWSSTLTTCAVGEASAENDATGFGAMPAGYSWKGTCGSYGTYSLFWTSSEGSTSNNAYSYALSYSNSVVEVYNYSSKVNNYSVRCLRNQTQPIATTATATNITTTSARLNGNVLNPENVNIIDRGFEWKPASGGTYAQVSASGSTMTYNLSGLTPSTSYTYRAYVTTSVGTKYGAEMTFTTLAPTQPTVTTSAVTNITTTSATLNGSISNPDNLSITVQGFEWKATAGGTYTAVNATGATMSYNLTGLTANTSYTYRAFVTTASGTNYGEEVTFTTVQESEFNCGTTTVNDHEGNSYNTVQIGSQCWTKENMRCSTSPKGYLTAAGNGEYSNYVAYYYNYSASSVPFEERGYLYNWAGALDTTATGNIEASFTNRRGICPEGWHIPSDLEWQTLILYLTSQEQYRCGNDNGNIAKALASKYYWNSSTYSCHVGYLPEENNSSGFSAVPAGCMENTSFGYDAVDADFHTSTSVSGSNLYRYSILSSSTKVDRISTYKSHGRSVRCIRNGDDGLTTVNMGVTGNSTLTTCEAFICDDGGVLGNNSYNCNSTLVVYPAVEGQGLMIDGATDMSTYGNTHLYFYEGEGTDGALLADYAGGSQNVEVVSATPITIQFVSTYSAAGFVLHVSCVTCLPPSNITATDIEADAISLSWDGSADLYDVYMTGADTGHYTTTDNSIVISGLSHSSTYNFQIKSHCGTDSSFLSSVRTFITPCGAITVTADHPWMENFEGYTGSGEQSFICWDRPIVDASYNSPFVYCGYAGSCHSGNNSAELKGASNMLVLPSFSNDIHDLRLSFWATSLYPSYGSLEIGVVDNALDPGSFELVGTTQQPSSRGNNPPENGNFIGYFDFSDVSAIQGRIALRYTSTFATNSWNLDDFVVEMIPTTPAVTSPNPCTVPSTHPAQTGSTYQNNGYSGANHGLETVTTDGKINSVTDYDGNEYPVVQIGSQCWLAENMRCTHSPSTGTYIVNNQFTSGTSIASTYIGKMARWYNNDSATYAPKHYGLLYNWNAAVDVYNTSYGELSILASSSDAVDIMFTDNRQGICPRGWHVPTDDEWTTMETVVNSGAVSGLDYRGSHAGKLAGGDDWTGSTASDSPGDYASANRNSSGFAAVPAGLCSSSFSAVGSLAYFWSSSQTQSEDFTYLAWHRYMRWNNAGVSRYTNNKDGGFSVRCLRN